VHARRYAIYGVVAGLGLPAAGTLVSAWLHRGSILPAVLGATHLADPVLWILDTAPLVLGALGLVIGRQHDALRAQHEEILRVERSRRDGFERAAAELSKRSRGLLGSVSSFTASTAETAAGVRATTATMGQLSRTATAAALTAETVVGLAQESDRAAAEGLRTAEGSSAALLDLADRVHGLSRRIAGLNDRMRDIFEVATAWDRLAASSRELAGKAREEARRHGGGAAGLGALVGEMDRHAEEGRETAARAKALLGEVHREMHGAVAAAEEGSGRAQEGAQVIHRAAETMRNLSRALGESARAAREIARASQQQETAIEQVRNAMNEIYLASEETETSTREVADEAQALADLAAALKRSVRQETPK